MKRSLYVILGLLIITCSVASAVIFSDIGADELKKMMDTKKQLVVIDTRTEQEFYQGHIPKAINIPPEKVSAIGAMLPKNKSATLVFYCRGVG